MPAPAAPLPAPDRLPDPATQSALAELLQLGLAVARVASHLAEVEDHAVGALAEAAAHTTRDALAPSHSLSDALEAGRNADTMDATRDAIAARVAAITDSFDKAARAVRRTAALQARLAEARPFHHRPPQNLDPASGPAPASRRPTLRRPADDAERPERPERPDTPEHGDELRGKPDEHVLQGICRDLATAKRSHEAIVAEPTGATTSITPQAPIPSASPAPHLPAGVSTLPPNPLPGTADKRRIPP